MRLSVQRAVYAVLVVFAISVFGYGASARAETTQDLYVQIDLGTKIRISKEVNGSKDISDSEFREIETYAKAWIQKIKRSFKSPVRCNLNNRYPMVRFEIDATGNPQNVRLYATTLIDALDNSAINCIKTLSPPTATPTKYHLIFIVKFDDENAHELGRQKQKRQEHKWQPLYDAAPDGSTSSNTDAEKTESE